MQLIFTHKALFLSFQRAPIAGWTRYITCLQHTGSRKTESSMTETAWEGRVHLCIAADHRSRGATFTTGVCVRHPRKKPHTQLTSEFETRVDSRRLVESSTKRQQENSCYALPPVPRTSRRGVPLTLTRPRGAARVGRECPPAVSQDSVSIVW